MVNTDLRAIAKRIRETAANPAPTPMPKIYVDGFTDGMTCCAAILEELAELKEEEHA